MWLLHEAKQGVYDETLLSLSIANMLSASCGGQPSSLFCQTNTFPFWQECNTLIKQRRRNEVKTVLKTLQSERVHKYEASDNDFLQLQVRT